LSKNVRTDADNISYEGIRATSQIKKIRLKNRQSKALTLGKDKVKS